MKFTPEYASVAVLLANGNTAIMSFLTLGRGHFLPSGAVWVGLGIWRRTASDAEIASEVARADFGSPVVSWQRITGDTALQADRDYRNALACVGGKLQHDIVKARDCLRDTLRGERANAMPLLDGEWMRATGQGKKAEADAVEAERQKWRDAPSDPRIDAAQSVEELKQIKVG